MPKKAAKILIADADGEMRYAANEVGGAVQWVDDPDGIGAVAVAGLEAALFGLAKYLLQTLANSQDTGLDHRRIIESPRITATQMNDTIDPVSYVRETTLQVFNAVSQRLVGIARK